MEKKRVKCLYRVSTMKQTEQNDIPMQRDACRAFAATHPDWEIIEEKYERGVSGYKVHAKDRDALMELLADAEAGKFDILLVYMMDRLGRIAEETALVASTFDKKGVEIWSAMEGPQYFSTHSDKLMNYIRFWTAEIESAKTSLRTKTRLEQIVKEGRFRGGVAPYGYRLEKQGRVNHKGQQVNEILIDESEAPVVVRMFELSASYGYGSRKIASTLTQEGYRNRKGQPFHPSTIQNMLKNILYTGVLRSGESRSEVFPHLQIIPEHLFELAQAQIKQHRSDYEGSRLSPTRHIGQALLSGNVYCGTCGGRLISTSVRRTHHPDISGNPRVPVYRCYNRIQHRECCTGQSTYRAEKIDTQVHQVVCQVLERIQLTNKENYLKQRQKAELNAVQSQLRQLENAYNQALEERKNLTRHIANALDGKGPFSPEDLKERIDTLKEEGQRLSQQMELQKELLEKTEKKEKAIEQQFQQLKSYAEIYHNATMEEKRRVVSALIERVTISRGYQIQIQFRVGLDLLENLES